MRHAYLVAESEDVYPSRVRLGDSLVIGRAADCELILEDASASRHHIQISARDDSFHWRDLGSTNGTLLNGMKVGESVLKEGDRIQIGETILRFELVDTPDSEPSPDSSTLFKQTIMNVQGELAAAPKEGKAEELLRAVYAAVNQLASNYDPCDLVDRIIEITVKAAGAQRGAVFFARDKDPELRPCPECSRYHVWAKDEIHHVNSRDSVRISTTVTTRVIEQMESVLYQDTDQSSELKAAESVMALNLRSIICVPLRGKSGVFGLMYLDSDREGRAHDPSDLLLCTAVGNSAGLALENARMQRQMLEKQRMDQEIQHAWTIQQGFLIRDWPEDEPQFEVFGVTHPAKTVGGDFYDFVRPAKSSIGILIGDVSGKGVPAALAMAQILAEFRLNAQRYASPAEVLGALNETLCVRSRRGLFCTICYILIDLATGRTRVANAGHHAPIRIGASGIEPFAEPSGPPIGVLPTAAWADTKGQLEPGEAMLLYTDGIAEARRPAELDTDYGEACLKSTLEGLRAKSMRDLVMTLHDDVLKYTEPDPPHDDCTLIAVRYLRP